MNDQPGTSSNEDDKSTIVVARAPLFWSCRLMYTLCAFLSITITMILRYNLSFSIVCMVASPTNVTHPPIQIQPLASPERLSEDNFSLHVIKDEFHWDKNMIGTILGSYYYGYVLFQPVGGWFSDRFGGKVPFVVSNLAQALLTFSIPQASRVHPFALCALRVLQGSLGALCNPALHALFTRWASPRERTKLFGWAYIGYPVGSMIVYPLSGFLCENGFAGGWPSIFYVTGLMGTVCSVVFWFLVYDSPESHPRISEKEKHYLTNVTIACIDKKIKVPWKSILLSVPVNAYHVVHFCCTWSFTTVGVILPLYLDEVLQYSIKENGIMGALPPIVQICARITVAQSFQFCLKCTSLSLTRFRKLNVFLMAVVANVSLVILGQMTYEHRYIAVMLLCVNQAASDIVVTAGYMLSFMDMAPRYTGVLMGMTNALAQVTGIITPMVVGLVTKDSTREQWAIVWYVVAALYMFGAIIYVLFGSSELQSWAKFDEDQKLNYTESAWDTSERHEKNRKRPSIFTRHRDRSQT